MNRIPVPFAWFPHWAVREVARTLSKTARLVYMSVVDHAEYGMQSHTWTVRIATTVIAEEQNIARESVRKALVELESAGLIARTNEAKRGRMPVFRIITTRVRTREMPNCPTISDAQIDPVRGGRDAQLFRHMEEPSTHPEAYAEGFATIHDRTGPSVPAPSVEAAPAADPRNHLQNATCLGCRSRLYLPHEIETSLCDRCAEVSVMP